MMVKNSNLVGDEDEISFTITLNPRGLYIVPTSLLGHISATERQPKTYYRENSYTSCFIFSVPDKKMLYNITSLNGRGGRVLLRATTVILFG